jgi:hypothetical protein
MLILKPSEASHDKGKPSSRNFYARAGVGAGVEQFENSWDCRDLEVEV